MPRGSYEDKNIGIEEWNAQTPEQHELGLGEYWAQSRGEHSLKNIRQKYLSVVKKDAMCYALVPRGDAYNAISQLSPTVKFFPIDVNHNESLPIELYTRNNLTLPASRDAAMAMAWLAIRKAYPDAIIIGNFGADHAPEQKRDNFKKKDNRNLGTDLNDPLGEQLVYANSQDGTDGANRIHTICIRATGTLLYRDASEKPVYINKKAFDEVWHVAPQGNSWAVPKKWFDPLTG